MAGGAEVKTLLLQVDASVALAQRGLASLRQTVDRETAAMNASLGTPEAALERLGRAFQNVDQIVVASKNQQLAYGLALDRVTAQELQAAQAIGAMAQATRGLSAPVQIATREQLQAAAAIGNFARQLNALPAVHGRAAAASSAQRAGMQQLGFQMQDFAVQVAGGTSASRAFAQQLPQATGAIALMAKEGSGLAKFMTGPWGIALAVGTALLGPLIGNLFEAEKTVESLTKEMAKNAATADMQRQADERYAMGVLGRLDALQKLIDANKDLGKSEQQRRDAQIEQIGRDERMSVGVLQMLQQRVDLERQLQAEKDKLAWGGLDEGESYASVRRQIGETGKALRELDARLESVGITAEQRTGAAIFSLINRILGLRDASQEAARAMRALQYVSEGLDALAAMDEAQTPQGRAAQNHRLIGTGIAASGLPPVVRDFLLQGESDRNHAVTEALRPHRRRGGGRAATQARQAESMEENARQTLLLADAYLQSANAATIAEARRKAFTDATRQGTEREARYARQLALTVAEQIAGSARSIRQMEDETAARRSVLEHGDENAGIEVTARSYHGLNREVEEALALAPLLRAQELATGDALVRATANVNEMKKALRERNQVIADFAYVGQKSRFIEAEQERAAQVAVIGSSSRWQDDIADLQARQAALREAKEQKIEDDPTATDDELRFMRRDYIDRAVAEARGQRDVQRRINLQGEVDAATRSNALLQEQFGLLRLGSREQESQLELLRLRLELEERYPGVLAAEKAKLMELAATGQQVRAQMEDARANLDEARQIGEQFIDDVLNPQNWENWGDAAKKIINGLISDLTRLAVINPLKNRLFGENNPVLGGVLGSLLRLFGGGPGPIPGASGVQGAFQGVDVPLPANLFRAAGGPVAAGQAYIVGEKRPELFIPRTAGTIIPRVPKFSVPANDNWKRAPAPVHQHFYLQGNMMTPEFWAGIEGRAKAAEAGGAAGGMAGVYKRAARQLPTGI